MVDYAAMGRRMRVKRRSKKISQTDLARAINISASYYGNIERGLRVPSIDTLVAIANALGVGTDYLLAESLVTVRLRHSPEEKRILYEYFQEQVEELDYGCLSEGGEEAPREGEEADPPTD